MAGQGFGILLEMWKVTKTVNVRIQRTNSLIPYRIIFEDKHVLTKTEADTQKYDKIAFVWAIRGAGN
jgi:Cleft lip and palate transmembrane protein 1 (CLPTM1)